MSHNLQGITFGFFENLSDEAKCHLEDILYGDKAQTARPDLPWDDETAEAVCIPDDGSECIDQVKTPENHVTLTPEREVVSDPLVTSTPETDTSAMPLQPPPGVPPTLYHHPGIQVVPGIQPMYTYVGMYPQQSLGSVPISYMQMVPPPAGPVPQHPGSVSIPTNNVSIDMHPDNNNYQNDSIDKEAAKILGGKTYERRNKKRRPADYYQKFGNTPGGQDSQQRPSGPPPNNNAGGIYNVVASSQPMMLSQPHMQYHTAMSVPVHQLHTTYVPHHSSPSHIVHGGPPHTTQDNHIIMPHGAPVPHFPPGMGAVPMSSPFMPPGAHVQGPPPPQRLPSNQLYQETPPAVTENEMCSQSEKNEEASVDPEPIAAPEEKVSEHHEQKDSSIPGEIYSNSSRTDPEVESSNISFGEVDDNMRNIAEEKNMFPWDQANNNVKKSPCSEEHDLASDEATEASKALTSAGNADVENSNAGDQDGILADKLSNCHLEPPAEGLSNSLPTPGAVPATEAEHQMPPCNQEEREPVAASPVCLPSPSQPSPVQSAESTLQINLEDPKMNATTQAPVKPKMTSWAGLFRGTTTAEAATVIYNSTNAVAPSEVQTNKEVESPPEPVSVDNEKGAKHLGNLLKDYTLSYTPPSIQPRGLVNRGNWCYVNATLQALLACSPFYNLLKRIPFTERSNRGASSTPIMDSIVEFANEFSPSMKPLEKNKGSIGKGNIRYDIPHGPVFEVHYIYKMLQLIKYDGFKTGRQEDAEEFLSCVLNGLHEEMSAAIKSLSGPVTKTSQNQPDEVTTNGEAEIPLEDPTADDLVDDDWEQVGPKKKSVVTRAANFDTSPISEIFRGQFRNILSRQGAKESATLQPFFTLQLDIQSEKIYTVQDALETLVSRETLQGVTCARTNVEVDASRRTMLEGLPPVLILHLKCFVYDKSGGCQKVVKQVDFSNELEINKDLLSPTVRAKYTQAQRKYKLFAVVKHIGVRAAGGHYTADVFYQSLGEWLHFDDNHVTSVSMPMVFKFRSPRIPYLLYYRRTDLS